MAKKQPKTGKEFLRLAEKSDRVKSIRPGRGSHFIVEFKNDSNISIPVHGNEQLDKGLLYKIIKVFKAAGVLVLVFAVIGMTSFALGLFALH